MNRRQASKIAKERYGPNSDAVAVSNVLRRNERFGIILVTPAGPSSPSMLFVLGYGDSFDSALAHALTSENGIIAADNWKKTLEQMEEFKKDPHATLEKMKSMLQSAEDELQSSEKKKTDDAAIL